MSERCTPSLLAGSTTTPLRVGLWRGVMRARSASSSRISVSSSNLGIGTLGIVAVALKIPCIAKRTARGAVDVVAIALVIVADYAIRLMAIERIMFIEKLGHNRNRPCAA